MTTPHQRARDAQRYAATTSAHTRRAIEYAQRYLDDDEAPLTADEEYAVLRSYQATDAVRYTVARAAYDRANQDQDREDTP